MTMKLEDIVNPKETVLLVIDMQNAYCSKDAPLPKLKKFDTSPIDEMVPRLDAFIEQARKYKVQIVWTKMIEDPSYAPENLRRKMTYEKDPPIASPDKPPTMDYYGVKPGKGEKEFIKNSYNAFTDKGFERFLMQNGAKNLILTGVYTSRCVDSTARAAFDKGYNVVIPQDLVAMPAQLKNEHDASLNALNCIMAYVVKSSNIVSAWKQKRLL